MGRGWLGTFPDPGAGIRQPRAVYRMRHGGSMRGYRRNDATKSVESLMLWRMTLRLGRGRPFFLPRRTLRLPALRNPPSPSITPGTDARRGERTLGIPRLKLALVQRRLYRLGALASSGAPACARGGRSSGCTGFLGDFQDLRHRSFLAETAVPRDFEEGESIIAGVVHERTTADRVARALDKLLHQVEQLERLLHPLLWRQQHDVRRHVERLLIAPLLGVASRHEPLPALDADLGAEHLLLVGDVLAVLAFAVVAVGVVGDFEQVVFHRLDALLTCLRVERGQFWGHCSSRKSVLASRAHESVTEVRVSPDLPSLATKLLPEGLR